MKVYPDANIYVTYLLGQKGEEKADRFFKQGIGCRFSIVASDTMFAEVAQRCDKNGMMLLQKNIDDLRKAGKLEVVTYTPEEVDEAYEIVLKTCLKYGRNDVLHTILAKKYADIFVTNDRNLSDFASKTQRVASLEMFVESKS